MSASTELLLEQINALNKQIATARANNDPLLLELEGRLLKLNKQLETSQQALNESTLLKS